LYILGNFFSWFKTTVSNGGTNAVCLVRALKVCFADPSVYWYKKDIIQLHSNGNASTIRLSKEFIFLLNAPLDKLIFCGMHFKTSNNMGILVMTNENAMTSF